MSFSGWRESEGARGCQSEWWCGNSGSRQTVRLPSGAYGTLSHRRGTPILPRRLTVSVVFCGFQEGMLLPLRPYPRRCQSQGADQGRNHLFSTGFLRADLAVSRSQDYMPGGALEHAYSDNTMLEYKNMGERQSMPPHAWNLASHCWQMLMAPVLVPPAESFNQAIVITGESGAGKSFQVRFLSPLPRAIFSIARACVSCACSALRLLSHCRRCCHEC